MRVVEEGEKGGKMVGGIHEHMTAGVCRLIVRDLSSERLSRFFGYVSLIRGSPPSDVADVGTLQVRLEDLADFGSGAVGSEDEIGGQAAASAFEVIEVHRDVSISTLDVRNILSGGIDGFS